MKNFDFIQCANVSMKNCSESLNNANKAYTSISQVLKDIQRKTMMEAGYASVFTSLGLAADGTFTPAQFFAVMSKEQFNKVKVGKGKTRHEEERLGIWGWTQAKDKDGNKLFEADGVTPKMEAVLRTVSAWTPTRLFKCIAQANAIKAQSK